MRPYEDSVFINVPFDRKVRSASAMPSSSLSMTAGSPVDPLSKSKTAVKREWTRSSTSSSNRNSESTTSPAPGIDRKTRLARFNMPLELGFFLGAKRYGNERDREKRCLILDRSPYRYRSFCSDISGQDIRVHNDQPRDAIRAVRDWLSSHRTEVAIPGGKAIFDRYQRFRAQLPQQAREINLDYRELTFNDYTRLVVGWLADESVVDRSYARAASPLRPLLVERPGEIALGIPAEFLAGGFAGDALVDGEGVGEGAVFSRATSMGMVSMTSPAATARAQPRRVSFVSSTAWKMPVARCSVMRT